MQPGDAPQYALHDHGHTVGIESELIADEPPRVVHALRWAGLLALILGIILMLGALIISARTYALIDNVNDRLTQYATGVDPAPTGCPAGEVNCGG